MKTQKEKAKWWDELYQVYKDECEEIKEKPVDEVEFNDEVQALLREEVRRLI